jgi:hypothetical protein
MVSELCYTLNMPTILRIGPYRFFFYSGDSVEPYHVHVRRDRQTAKFWLSPVRLERSGGFTRQEINQIQRLVEENESTLMREWDEYFDN